tara:strand:- start:150 stop:401 length:252 start_codon:yes stop_codon:yes gene_type:complete
MYYEETLSQVNYDTDQYLRKIEAIKKAKGRLNEFKGKPMHGVLLQSIEEWKNGIIEIEKTLIPYIEKLSLNLRDGKYLDDIDK